VTSLAHEIQAVARCCDADVLFPYAAPEPEPEVVAPVRPKFRQEDLLELIATNPDHWWRPRAMARHLGVPVNSVGHALRRLVAKGVLVDAPSSDGTCKVYHLLVAGAEPPVPPTSRPTRSEQALAIVLRDGEATAVSVATELGILIEAASAALGRCFARALVERGYTTGYGGYVYRAVRA
jgi:hypothetical protein